MKYQTIGRTGLGGAVWYLSDDVDDDVVDDDVTDDVMGDLLLRAGESLKVGWAYREYELGSWGFFPSWGCDVISLFYDVKSLTRVEGLSGADRRVGLFVAILWRVVIRGERHVVAVFVLGRFHMREFPAWIPSI
uniref:Uncharacterized protein n=1 Tax=Ciona savignyi TaxID=51511 RepID=H2Y5W5_CIOSA